MGFHVRAARLEDAAAMVALLNPIIAAGNYTILQGPLSVEDQVAFIRRFPERGVFHVAVCEATGRVLGMQDVEALSEDPVFRHVGVIGTFVALDSLRQGVGRRLSEVTFRAARELGFTRLSATIRADNPRAVAFYRSQGFRIIGTAQRHAFVDGRYVDEVLAERFLDD